jgi:hypothetical protein
VARASVAMANVAGPLPKSGSFQSAGGQLLLTVTASAYKPPEMTGTLTISVQLDGSALGELKVYTNEPFSHKAFPGRSFLATAAAGAHTVTLTAGAVTTSDVNDYFNVTVLEFDQGGP